MSTNYPIEDVHVGRQLAIHRENLGLTWSDVVAAWADEMPNTVGQIEHTARPHLWDLEAYHKAVIAAWEASVPRAETGRAMREQWITTDADWRLWDAAKTVSPTAKWWWGPRSDLRPGGAHCYICRTPIYGYNVQKGLSRPARRAVMAHRITHIDALAATGTARLEVSHL